MRKRNGFTLIELLVIIFIMAILGLVAASVYTSYSLKGRRADGISAILTLQLAEERYRSTNTTYGTLAQISGASSSPQGYYTMTISGVSATAFTITATAVGNQANDKENGVTCTPLVLTSSGGTITQTPAACWPT